MSEAPHLTVAREDGVQIATPNRPEKLNVISDGMMARLEEVLIEKASKMAALGVEVVGANIPGHSLEAWCDGAEHFAKEVLTKIG